jgi:hypothetical protein
VTRQWLERIAADAAENGADARLAVEYAEAFGAAQDALAPPPPMTPEEYAILTVAVQRKGSPARPLAERGLTLADYTRLARHFARLFVADPSAEKRFFDAFLLLQPKPDE